MAGLHDTLQAFARHVRDPHHAPVPAGISPRGMAVYAEIAYNNLSGFPDACFPITRQVLGAQRWQRLQKRFMRDWPCQTPWFREIPREFLAFLLEVQQSCRLPRWTSELAHYEWAELAVDVMDAPLPAYVAQGDLRHGVLVVNPALLNLSYHWPVHRIGPDFRPRKPQPTFLAVYRDADLDVQFTQLTPASSCLLDGISRQALTGEAAIRQLAAAIGQGDGTSIMDFGLAELQHFHRLGLILGVAP